jgi:hypothetical protein
VPEHPPHLRRLQAAVDDANAQIRALAANNPGDWPPLVARRYEQLLDEYQRAADALLDEMQRSGQQDNDEAAPAAA